MQVAPEVAELLSTSDLETLRQSAASGYRCLVCDRPGLLATDPASVVIHLGPAPGAGPQGPRVAHVRLAHTRCSVSKVVARASSPPLPAEAAMTATAAVLPHPSGRRALLIAEPSAHLSAVTSPGERADPLIAGLLTRGLHLLPALGEPAPPAPGWTVQARPSGVIVCEPSGDVFYAGDLPQPREWRKITRTRGTVELITGVVGLRASGPEGPSQAIAALENAARRGRLIGGTVTIR
jgi:hypothetical protein